MEQFWDREDPGLVRIELRFAGQSALAAKQAVGRPLRLFRVSARGCVMVPARKKEKCGGGIG